MMIYYSILLFKRDSRGSPIPSSQSWILLLSPFRVTLKQISEILSLHLDVMVVVSVSKKSVSKR